MIAFCADKKVFPGLHVTASLMETYGLTLLKAMGRDRLVAAFQGGVPEAALESKVPSCVRGEMARH
jgi:hypothetical protein